MHGADTKAELECAHDAVNRHEAALIDKERQFCQKLEKVRAEDSCKIRQLSCEMYQLLFITARSELRKLLFFGDVSLWFFVCVGPTKYLGNH